MPAPLALFILSSVVFAFGLWLTGHCKGVTWDMKREPGMHGRDASTAYTSLHGIDRLLGLRLWTVHLLVAAPPGANTHHELVNKQQDDKPE